MAALAQAIAPRCAPKGGTIGQVLTKASAADHDMAWGDAGGGGEGATSILGFVANTAMTTDIAGSNADITWDTEYKKSTGFTHAANGAEITIGFDGEVEIDADVGINGATNRVELTAYVVVNGVQVDRSRFSDYVARDASQNDGAISLSGFYLPVSAGDAIKLNAAAVVDGGAATIDPDQTRIHVKRIDNLAGPKGDTGAAGVVTPFWGIELQGTVPAGDTTTLMGYAPYAMTIDALHVQAGAGGGTVSLSIDGVAITGLTGVAVGTTRASHAASAANAVPQGGKLAFVVATSADLEDLHADVVGTRT